MARVQRVVVANFPHHVTQRGNRKQQTFFSAADYRAYVDLLAEAKSTAEVSIWAYCLMPNHVHLVVVPEKEQGLVRLMQHPHRRYAWRINRRMGWQGHLWQSRFFSCPMDEEHLITAVRYVELNPVRAGLCVNPREWRWSSVHAHATQQDDELVTVQPMLDRVGDWESYLSQANSKPLVDSIRRNSASGRPAGNDSFVELVERMMGRRLRKRRPGPAPSRIGS